MSALYDVENLQSLSYDVTTTCETILPKQIVSAQSLKSNVALIINNSLSLLSDNGSTCEETTQLDCMVDCIAWSDDGKYLVLGDSVGFIHIVASASAKLIFSQEVVNIKPATSMSDHSECFSCLNIFGIAKGCYCVAVGLRCGIAHVFSNIDLDAFTNDGFEVKSATRSKISHGVFDFHSHHDQLSSLVSYHLALGQGFFTSGFGSDVLVSWKSGKSLFTSEKAHTDYSPSITVTRSFMCRLPGTQNSSFLGFSKICVAFNAVYCMSNEGHLYQFEANNLLLLKWWHSYQFHDIAVRMPCSPFNQASPSLARVYAMVKEPNSPVQNVVVFKIPEMEKVFSETVDETATFCAAPCVVNDVVWTEGPLRSEEEMDMRVNVKCISQASPDSRLLILLQQHKFAEAIQFAKKYSLDPQPIYKQQASFLLHSMENLTDQMKLNSTFEAFCECANKVSDSVFVSELCTSVSLPDITLTFRLLTLAREHIDSGGRSFRASLTSHPGHEQDLHLRLEIDKLLDLVVTFQMAFSSSDATTWLTFSSRPLAEQVAGLLATGHLQSASVICVRHEADLFSYLKQGGEESLQKLLKLIPQDVATDSLVSWLEDVIPSILSSSLPNSVETLASWLHERSETLEEIFPDEWPENGLKLANVFFLVQRQLSSTGSIREEMSATYLVHKNKNEQVSKLQLLVSRLQLLCKLQTRYQCTVSLSEFIKETTTSLAFRMLDKVRVPELIPKSLETTLRPYMKEHKLNEDQTLLQYIEDALTGCHENSRGAFQSIRERKVIAVIKCMRNDKVVAEATARLAKKASIPWSNDVTDLVKAALESTKSESTRNEPAWQSEVYRELQHYVHLERIPSITAKYNVSEFFKRDAIGNEKFVRYLINQDSEEALGDAIEVAHTFSSQPKEAVYIYQAHHLIKKKKISECVELLVRFPDLAVTLVKRVLCRAFLVMERTDTVWAGERADYAQSAISMVEYMMRDFPGHLDAALLRDWKDALEMYRNIYSLQSQYGELVSVNDYNDKRHRDAILNNHIVTYYRNHSGLPHQAAIVQTNVSELDASKSIIANQSCNQLNETEAQGDAKPPKNRETFASVIFLARLLQVPQQTMQSKIAVQAAKKCQAEASIKLCRDLFDTSPSASTAETLHRVALLLFQQLENHPDIIFRQLPNLRSLAGLASTCCREDDLLNVMALYDLCNIAAQLFLASDTNKKAVLSQCMTSGPKVKRSQFDHTEWLHGWYREEDGLNLDADQLIPLIGKLRTSLINEKGVSLACTQPVSVDAAKATVAKLGEVSAQLVEQLLNARRCTMSMRLVVKCRYTLISHLSNHKSFYNRGSKLRKSIQAIIFTTMKKGGTEVKGFLETLVEKVLLSREPDVALAIGLLLDLEPEHSFQILTNIYQGAGKNFKRISAVAQTGLTVARKHGLLSRVPRFESLLLDSKWAQNLSPLQIAVDSFVCSSQQWKQKFLLRILAHPEMTGAMILDYCNDYGLDRDQSLLQFVKVLLGADILSGAEASSPHSPDTCMIEFSRSSTALLAVGHSYKTPKPSSNNRDEQDDEETFPWSKVKEELRWLVQHIRDKYELRRQLEHCLYNHVTPYDYDRAEFLLYVIESCQSATRGILNVTKGLGLISCLRQVKRNQPPSDFESRRLWHRDHRENFAPKSSTKLAAERLPLHPLLYGDAAQAWKIIGPELDDKSAHLLAPVVKLLGLDVDQLYMVAAENVITRYTQASKIDGNAALATDVFAHVQALTEKMTSCTMAVAMAKRISEVLSPGEDKVAAYKWCISLVDKWRETITDDSDERQAITNAHQTLVWSYKQADTEALLARHALDSPDLLKLMNQPTNLVVQLYKHPSIVRRFFEPGDKYPDIHAVVEHLGEVHGQDVTKLRLTMIWQLLLAADKPDTATAEDDTTTNLERIRTAALIQEPTERSEGEKELIHLIYLLTHTNPLKQATYLVRLIGDHKNRKFTNACRVRAINCLLHIANDSIVQSLTDKTGDQLRSELRILVYLTQLEAAHFKIPSAHLRRSDKSSVARSIVASPAHRHNPLALRAAADLCREFGPVAPETWAVLLQHLVSLQQVTYLQQLLPSICLIPAVRSLSCLASVWQSCVTLPLVALTPPLDTRQRDAALTSYRFLMKCPVLLRIDISGVAQHFKVLDLQALALGCMLISPGERCNATSFATDFASEIEHQLGYLHSDQRPLLGYTMINDFLRRLNA